MSLVCGEGRRTPRRQALYCYLMTVSLWALSVGSGSAEEGESWDMRQVCMTGWKSGRSVEESRLGKVESKVARFRRGLMTFCLRTERTITTKEKQVGFSRYIAAGNRPSSKLQESLGR
jgi:hypothetical protein